MPVHFLKAVYGFSYISLSSGSVLIFRNYLCVVECLINFSFAWSSIRLVFTLFFHSINWLMEFHLCHVPYTVGIIKVPCPKTREGGGKQDARRVSFKNSIFYSFYF